MKDFLQTIYENKYNRYARSEVIGEGTFGVVYKGEDTKTKQVVAVKKIRMGNKSENGISFSALREIKVLQELKHDNIIELVDVFLHKSNVYLVYEFMDTDLQEVIRDQQLTITPSDIKGFMRYILEGVNACHSNWILHRDLKPSNILVSRNRDVKLADFGLAKVFGSPDKRYSPQCVTLWYKPPELLFGSNLYGPSVDMWSVGCIFAELMLRRPFLPGENDLDQLGKIFAALGTPTEQEWPNMKSLPNYIEFEEFPRTPLKQIFTAATDDALDLLNKMLQYDPNKRISSQEALVHPYFSNQPKPTLPKDLPLPRKVFDQVHNKLSQEVGNQTTNLSKLNRASKVLIFDDVMHEDLLNNSLNTSNLSAFSTSTLNESLNHSNMADDSETIDLKEAGSEKRRRGPGVLGTQDEDEDMDGERPSVRRKLAL